MHCCSDHGNRNCEGSLSPGLKCHRQGGGRTTSQSECILKCVLRKTGGALLQINAGQSMERSLCTPQAGWSGVCRSREVVAILRSRKCTGKVDGVKWNTSAEVRSLSLPSTQSPSGNF